MIIKQSWILGFFISLFLPIILVVMVVSIYLTFIVFGEIIALYIVIVSGLFFFIFSFLLYWTVLYLAGFRKIHKVINNIITIESAENIVQQGDRFFARFFNQMTDIYFLMLAIAIFNILYITLTLDSLFDFYVMLDIVCFGILMWLTSHYRKSMVRLEMTYNIVVPGYIYFMDQKSIYTGTEILEPQRIKLIKSTYPHFIASLLNYGNIEVFPDRMPVELGKMDIHYIDDPINTSDRINKLLLEGTREIDRSWM